jgi:hypothetical protein
MKAQRQPIDRARLVHHLAEQTQFMRASAAAFDAGFEGEAKRMAVAIRILVHDTEQSQSLLRQLDMKTIKFIDTAHEFDPKNLLSHAGLVGMELGPNGARYKALLGNRPNKAMRVTFHDWWNKPVFVDRERNVLTRKDLVTIAANQDGVAHVDPALDARYANLAQALGWQAVSGSSPRFMEGAEAAAIRQITYELLETLDQATAQI